MDKVWIVTTKIQNYEIFIEGVFDSYESAHTAAEDLWRKLEPPYHSYLWKRRETEIPGSTSEIQIWSTNSETFKENNFATININSYPVWH